MLSTGRKQGQMNRQQKQLVLDVVKACGAFESTKAILDDLLADLLRHVKIVEEKLKAENMVLRAALELLRI